MHNIALAPDEEWGILFFEHSGKDGYAQPGETFYIWRKEGENERCHRNR